MSKLANAVLALGIGLAPLTVGIPSAVADDDPAVEKCIEALVRETGMDRHAALGKCSPTPVPTLENRTGATCQDEYEHAGWSPEEAEVKCGGDNSPRFAVKRKVHEERHPPSSSSNSTRSVLQAVFAVSLLGFAGLGLWYRKTHKPTDPIPAQPVYTDYLSTPVSAPSYAPAPEPTPTSEPTPEPIQTEEGDGW